MKEESGTASNEMACSAADNVFPRRMLMAAGDQKQPFHLYLFVFVEEFVNKVEHRGALVQRRESQGPWEEEMTLSKCT